MKPNSGWDSRQPAGNYWQPASRCRQPDGSSRQPAGALLASSTLELPPPGEVKEMVGTLDHKVKIVSNNLLFWPGKGACFTGFEPALRDSSLFYGIRACFTGFEPVINFLA